MPLEQLEEDQLNSLKKLLHDHKGEKQLHFTLYDREDKVKLNMPSRKHKVNISKELLGELTNKKLLYQLN